MLQPGNTPILKSLGKIALGIISVALIKPVSSGESRSNAEASTQYGEFTARTHVSGPNRAELCGKTNAEQPRNLVLAPMVPHI